MPKVNLSEYVCIPTKKEYTKIYNKFLKTMIPKKINPAKIPTYKIFMGAPGSGKSSLAEKDKNVVIIDVDDVINQLPEMIKLLKMKVKHGNLIESCNQLGMQIAEEIEVYCIKKRYNISAEWLNGPPFDHIYYMVQNGYIIKSYYVYTYDAYKNNVKRKKLNLSKKVYFKILDDMHDYTGAFAAFKCSDSFEFICYGKKCTPKTWGETEKKINKILSNIKKRIK